MHKTANHKKRCVFTERVTCVMASKLLIAFNINVCVLCIFIMCVYINTHAKFLINKYFYIIYILYKYKYICTQVFFIYNYIYIYMCVYT